MNKQKSVEHDERHPRALRELSDIVAKPFSVIFEKSWQEREVPVDWRKGNIILIFKKSEKEGSGNYQPVCLTSVPMKIMRQILPEAVLRYMEHRAVIQDTQHDCTKGKCIPTIP